MIERNIIIDIKTLGKRNDAAITQVGLVIANKNFNILDKFLIQVDPTVWHTCNRTFTGETLLWWLQQNDSPISKTCNYFIHSYKELIDTLNQIFWESNLENAIVWTKSTMDLFCIKDIFEYFDMETPWKSWQPRDIGTAEEFVKEWKFIDHKNAHNALDDAITELIELQTNLNL